MNEGCRVCGSDDCRSFIETPAQMHDSRAEMFNFSRCAECGYVFLDPPVAPSALKNYYTEFYLPYRGARAWGKYAPQVARSDAKLAATRAEWVGRAAPVGPSSLVLDIGCGRPDFLRECAARYGCRAAGLDFSDAGWRAEPARFKGLDLRVGEVSDLPAAWRPDVVTMWHYLEHDYDPARTLRALADRAGRAAVLIAEVPDFDSESRRRFGPHWAGWHTPRHVSLFSENNLRMLLENNGWPAVEIRREGTLDPYVLYWMSRMERKGIAWNKNMEDEFFGFVAGWLAFFPKRLRRGRPLGIMTAVARRTA